MDNPILVSAAALNQTPLDWEGNVWRIKQAIEKARAQNSSILLLPELCLTGYGCEDYFLMDWVIARTSEVLRNDLLPAIHGLVVAIGMPVLKEGKRYNCLAICENGAVRGFYAKQLLARNDVYYEPRWFDAWPANHISTFSFDGKEIPIGDITIRHSGITIGFEICEDAWHPTQRPAIIGAARDADLILNASASHHGRGKPEERKALITGLQDKNPAFYLYTNLVGNESGRIIFDGEILFGNNGEILKSSDRFSMQDVVVHTFELKDEKAPSPTFSSAEQDFEDFTAAVSLGLLDYLRKSGSRGFALSLSGGADSAACAVLVAEMVRRAFHQLGKAGLEAKLGLTLNGETEKEWVNQLLVCVYQGTQNSGSITRTAAEKVARETGAEFHSWEVDDLVQGYTSLVERAINQPLTWKKNDLVLQNIQARTRAPGIWMLANTRNFLLLSTSNRSEGDVGYCTMDGDMAGSLAPIAGMSKHFIRQWLVWAKDRLGYSSLKFIINQAPTAELRPPGENQTDEGDLMPYDLLEAIEEQLIGFKRSETLALHELKLVREEPEEYLKNQITRFVTLWKRSQWKRDRLAPSFHLDWFGIDPKSSGRYPILTR